MIYPIHAHCKSAGLHSVSPYSTAELGELTLTNDLCTSAFCASRNCRQMSTSRSSQEHRTLKYRACNMRRLAGWQFLQSIRVSGQDRPLAKLSFSSAHQRRSAPANRLNDDHISWLHTYLASVGHSVMQYPLIIPSNYISRTQSCQTQTK